MMQHRLKYNSTKKVKLTPKKLSQTDEKRPKIVTCMQHYIKKTFEKTDDFAPF